MFHQFKLTFVLILYMRLFLESHATTLDICLICRCQNVRTNIDCSYHQLSFIPQPIPPNVEYLDFKGNNIEEIKVQTFRNLSNLKSL
ncbi:leucine-rich repeat-containing protein 4-like [Octopus bimaculoides]|uniref:leucine-rich repeat-containing protein 4-like n=1 Tax=Octopus bimaculoides TaxID=37653 RepID=UPI0022E14136|nr:leucine-rich repeat-containing protein 4-like [Octopus bimaculoides]